MTRAVKAAPDVRHVVSINDLTNGEIETVFEVAQQFLDELPDPNFPYRIGRNTDIAAPYILGTLFYEPSTRTRLSFESAMLRLGGRIITSADPATSSAAKGESLADSVRVVANYADIMVLRHPRDGAARLAAEYSPIPIVNGGDGSHEHPTQTLCDIFTIRKRNKTLKNLSVAISGDLKGSRTIHSFVYALARFNANILMMPAKGMELPPHVDSRLREEFHCVTVPKEKYGADNQAIDALYITPEEPHQLSLIPGSELDDDASMKIWKTIHAVYVTRFQKERWAEKDQSYPRIDAHFLSGPEYSRTSVLHPLPRVGELDAALDMDARAVYFEQAAHGVPIRMALLSLLLGLHPKKSLARFAGGFVPGDRPLYDQPLSLGARCANANCISHDPMESQSVRNRFFLAGTQDAPKARCFYCESDLQGFVIADRKRGHFTTDASSLGRLSNGQMKEAIIFRDAEEAHAAGFALKEDGRRGGTKRRAHG